MATKVIINADDFGYSNSVNYGILDSHLNGVLTSTTLMANMPGFNHAVAIKKATPTLGVGVHLVMSCGAPVLKTHTEIVNENGMFRNGQEYFGEGANFPFTAKFFEELEVEWTAQIEKVYEAGITPTHLDGHHHLFVTFPETQAISIKLAQKYNLPMRVDGMRIMKEDIPAGIPHVDYFEGRFDEVGFGEEHKNPELKAAYYAELLAKIKEYDTVEIMTHPAYIGKEIMEGSSWSLGRIYVTEELINSDFAKKLKADADIKLVTYDALK